MELTVNGRFSTRRTTGVERYAIEVTKRLKTPFQLIAPDRSLGALAGHLWEQTVLPAKAANSLLWSPCNTGPLLARRHVLAIHDMSFYDHPEWFSPRFNALYCSLLPVLARKALQIVTDSDYSKSRICAAIGVPGSKVQVVGCGVDERFQPALSEAVETAKAEVGIAGRPYFATLGSLEPRKNLKLVLKAWSRARMHLPADTVLLVMGGGGGAAFRSDSPESTTPEDGVIYSGYISDDLLRALLSGAIALLYPSLYEGFGLPLLEAMACGTVGVTSRLTSLPEVGGDAAIYVDPYDPEDLAKVLEDLANSADLRAAHETLGLQRSAMFNWTASAALVDAVLQRFL